MKIIRNGLIGCVRFYQVCISPWWGGRCRFYPTCSHYAIEALHQHGIWYGMKLTLCRLIKCHPFGPSGLDPVPKSKSCSHDQCNSA